MPQRIAIEAWNPDFGSTRASSSSELEPSDAHVDATVELAPARWKPLAPSVGTSTKVAFVDGVRRIDALVWITGDDGATRMGSCASIAAGTVEAGATAAVTELEIRRGLYTSAPVADLETRIGRYGVVSVSGEDGSQLSAGIQRSLRSLEAALGAKLESAGPLVVVDGPLSSHPGSGASLGYIKSHSVRYLDDTLTGTVQALAPGERTPLFLTTTSWSRYSSYLRLPGPKTHPWAGIVRIEIAAEARIEEATRLADLAAATLPCYASVPHKDPRAPQNLFPIGGLERELRRRLGDAALVHRALRSAAASLLEDAPLRS